MRIILLFMFVFLKAGFVKKHVDFWVLLLWDKSNLDANLEQIIPNLSLYKGFTGYRMWKGKISKNKMESNSWVPAF